jgi:hypothetical protein
MVVCAIGIMLAIGILGGRVPRVYADAVDDHVDHCSYAAMANGATDPDLLKNEGAAKHCGVAVLPDISQYGFGDPHGRLCDLAGEEFLHLVYYNSDKQPLSVFVSTHSSRDIAGIMRLLELSGYTIAAINASGVDLIVLTTLDQRRTRQIAEAIEGQVRQAAQTSQMRGADPGPTSPAVRRPADVDFEPGVCLRGFVPTNTIESGLFKVA